MRAIGLVLCTLSFLAVAAHGAIAPDSIPREIDESTFGTGLRRTMQMLEASNAGDSRPIRVLFYGQSIIAQAKVQETLLGELRRRYPKANIIATNNTIGGYTAPSLVRTMVHDVVPFRPDLIVFDDYGGEADGSYEQIIRFLRSQTTADILMWSPHLDNYNQAIEKERETTAIFRRAMAAKYRCEFADLRGVWARYLEQNQLPRTALLQDAIHNNAAGCELMGMILARHFVKPPAAATASDAVKTIFLVNRANAPADGVKLIGVWQPAADGQGIDLAGPDSSIELEFTGNRVDLIGPADAADASARVLIDGQPPAALPMLWMASRPSAGPVGWFPAINRITLGDTPILSENWTLHFFDVDKAGKSFHYRLTGSVTGDDGQGDQSQDFASQSGRIRFLASDVTLAESARVIKKDLPASFDVTWRTFPLGLDEYHRQRGQADGDDQTLVNGLPNRTHHLSLTVTKGVIAIRALVVYRPEFPATELPATRAE